MTTPYQQPNDAYQSDPTTNYSADWSALSGQHPQSAQMVPYQAMLPDPRQESARERRAVTLRLVIALSMAIPLTAIAAASMSGGLGALAAMAMTWVGIALVTYLSHGKGFPFGRG